MSGQKILAFGTGVFLRAFLCDFADRAAINGAINSVVHGVTVPVTLVSSTEEGDRRVEQLRAQNGAFTLALRGQEPGGTTVDTYRTVRSITVALSAAREWPAVLQTSLDPAMNIVSSNVTESALCLHTDDTEAATPEEAAQGSFPAKLTAWLYRRYERGLEEGDAAAWGVTVLPCELVAENGAVLLGLVDQMRERWQLPLAFGTWLSDHCTFADTLVDRIVAGAPPDSERPFWQARLGYDDPLLTVGEPYALWAIRGDAVLAERLRWLIDVGAGQVVITDDITPYTTRKVRLLNGLHTAMASIAPLPIYGVETVGEAIRHPLLGPFLHDLLYREILPTVCPPLAEDDAHAYADSVWARMGNPFLTHQLSAIRRGAIAKWENRLFPTVAVYRERFGSPPPNILACWQAHQAAYGLPDNLP